MPSHLLASGHQHTINFVNTRWNRVLLAFCAVSAIIFVPPSPACGRVPTMSGRLDTSLLKLSRSILRPNHRLYNDALAERKNAWEQEKRSVSY